jgi:hypothetical protein
MRSFKGKGQDQGSGSRRGRALRDRRRGFLNLESLEERLLLSPAPTTPSTNLADIKNGPMADSGQDLIDVYQTYLSDSGNASQVASTYQNLIEFQNGMVGIDTNWNSSGHFSDYVTAMTNLGMQITATSDTYGIIEGFLPISQLPTVAQEPQTLSLRPIYRPIASVSYQGVGQDQALQAMQADVAQQTYGVTGKGVTVGVLSTSVNSAPNPNGEPPGLAGSVQSGDLPSNVNVVQELPPGLAPPSFYDDEGRAMLEGIHDVAPGAGLAYATGSLGHLSMAQNIQALHSQAGASVLVDDIAYADDPYFQDGIIAQSINTVTTQGASYFSSAGNDGPYSGYLSQFRSAQATVGSLGAGTYMNFNPSGGVTTELPITTTIPNAELFMEYDQPYKTEEPVGSTAGVTSDLDFFILDSAGNVVASSTTNNIQTQSPLEDLAIPKAGNYFVVIQLVNGSAPGHVEFRSFNDTYATVAVSQQFGNAGGTYYPTSAGHATAQSAIGVGAVPWWATAVYANQSPLGSEPFSSPGPALSVFNPDGSPKAAPQLVQTPVVSGVDGTNTSFFGIPLNTTTPPNPTAPATAITPAIPGEPATPTNLASPTLRPFYFFGTSQSAPNVAAVAALMKQLTPGLNAAEVRAGLVASALPLNGAGAGTWNPQGGFGLVNAPAALNAVKHLFVTTVTPTNNTVTALSPGAITFTFSEPVNFSTISASDLIFTGLPPGVSVSVGAPIAVDNPQSPTIVAFPIVINRAPGTTLANGQYSYTLQGPVVGQDGETLSPFLGSFNLQATDGPRITGTTLASRIIQVQLNEALNPATVNASTFSLVRAGGPNLGFGLPSNVVVTADPRTVVSYNPLTDVVTIDLTNLDQFELPTDHYEIVVQGGNTGVAPVLDQAGLALDGEFSGLFPSGDGNPGGSFIQDLGVKTLQPPVVTAVKLDPSTDSGIAGDENTNITTPLFDGQVTAAFPTALGGLTVLAQFNSLHGGNIDLAPGMGGRGSTGTADVTTHTDANGHFTIQAPTLFEGFQLMRVVVVGAPDSPPEAGLSSSFDHQFRIDTTAPSIVAVTSTPGGAALPSTGNNFSSLSSLSFNVLDPASPAAGTLAIPTQLLFPALNPTTADNLGNYSLILLPTTPTGTPQDESQFLASAIFTATDTTFALGSTPLRTSTSDPFAGRIDLSFKPGLPAGTYTLTVHSGATASAGGVQDAAGNPLDNSSTSTAVPPSKDFVFSFSVQSQPVFITDLALQNSSGQTGSTIIGGPQSYFEVPTAGVTPRAPAPPTSFFIDFSTPLRVYQPGTTTLVDYSDAVQLIASADGVGATPDGDFGTLGIAGQGSTGNGFMKIGTLNDPQHGINRVVTVTLVDPTGKLPGDPGFSGTRLVWSLTGTPLSPDHYRIYLPNTGSDAIFDIFGNQLDGEFLGNLAANNTYIANSNFDGYTASPITATGNFLPATYQDLLPDGTYRQNDLSGDGTAGGAFETGFTVVPNGSILYARPDYVENPLDPTTFSDGSLAKPYTVLAPQAAPNATNGGDLNAPSNFFNFDPAHDLAGIGRFASSAFYAASQLSLVGPVVIVALPATPQRDPITGAITVQSFGLQSASDGSASLPFDTTLAFDPGTTLKLLNASLFVQNQGTALQAFGFSNSHVVFTSVNDATVGFNNNSGIAPKGGDWGGLVVRNYDESANSTTFPVDGTLQGPNGLRAISGADDALSLLNFAEVRYAGGAVPATQGIRYDAITLYNSRPTLTNDNIYMPNGATAQAQAAISGDLDSFREDDLGRGPLIRQTTVADYSLNGIWVRPNLVTGLTGVAEQTNAIPYVANPTSLGGNTNFTFADPLPYILTSQLILGEELEVNTGGLTTFVNDRLYIQPGMIIKSDSGAGISLVNGGQIGGFGGGVIAGASLNIGSRTYINEYDANPNFTVDPTKTATEAEHPGDAQVIFTSLYDYDATTALIPNKINSANDTILPSGETANQPDLKNSIGSNLIKLSDGSPDPIARWGSVGIQSGAVAVVNDAEFRYGGGAINDPHGTLPSQSVLAFITEQTLLSTPLNSGTGGGGGGGRFTRGGLFSTLAQLGTHVIVTNNNFFANLDTPMQIEPNGLLAADPLRPLQSGNPFFSNNLLQRNDIDGLAVVTSRTYQLTADQTSVLRPQEAPLVNGSVNLTVNSVWDDTDITYVLRGTIVLAGYYDNPTITFVNGVPSITFNAPIPSTVAFEAEQTPFITLTIQSLLPGTPLADGTTIPSPGASVLVKMMNDYAPNGAGVLSTYGSSGVNGNTGASVDGGAGFIVGVDDGVDPPNTNGSPLIDPGVGSQIRILGIAGDQTTGQQRVPVILTSLRDGTVGKTIRGIKEFNIYNNDPLQAANFKYTTPAAGDGGYVYYGGNSLTDMNLQDPRDGSLIDNADIRYMTSIQIQGGGIIDLNSTAPGFQSWLQTKVGQTPTTQFNSAMAITISDSNLANFSDAAVFVHPTSANALVRDLSVLTTGGSPSPARDANRRGEGVVLYMVNDTIANSGPASGAGGGVLANSDNIGLTGQPSPIELVLINNTFYNNPVGLHTVAPVFAPGTTPTNDQVYWLAMDNIFSNSSNTGILADGEEFGSLAQYNLYFQNLVNLNVINNTTAQFQGNFGAVLGNPEFVDPINGNFQLQGNSAAIDAARSEIGPLVAGDAIFPTVTQVLDATGGIRTDPTTLVPPATPGRSTTNGGLSAVTDPRKQVTLPGSPGATFENEWVPVLATAPNAIVGPTSNAATFAYTPITGERDAFGQLRVDDPNVPNIGFGSRPFFDIGAYEFVQYNPPEVIPFSTTTNIPVTLPGGTSKDLYLVGGVSGVNQVPQTIQIRFNHQLDPTTITSQSVLLVGSGGTGTFGGTGNVTFDLTGRLSYSNSASGSILTISMAGLNLPTDEYEIVLDGTGSHVIKDLQGNALDGENTPNDDPNGAALALPSGNGIPGGNFFLQFTIDTHPASLVPGSLHMDPNSDTNRVGDAVTANTTPVFDGQITDIFPPTNPLLGDTVFLDVYDYTTNQFVQVGQGVTNATGNFSIAPTAPLPNTPYVVGPDGLLENGLLNNGPIGFDPDDAYLGLVRVRIVDQAGNVSAPSAWFPYIVDTTPPVVTSESPAPGTLASTSPVTITFTTNKNIDPNTLNAGSVSVTGAGPDGIFGTADDVPVSLAGATFSITPLKNGALGPEQISFTLPAGLANDQYQVILRGTGANPITDIAGNRLNGSLTTGTDVAWTFVVGNAATARFIFVGPAADVTNPAAVQGSRANPFPTIGAAITVAKVADTVAVLPGTYVENVTLKSLVRVLSASLNSTDSALQPGNTLQTVIQAPTIPAAGTTQTIAVTAANLFSVPGLQTELGGISVDSPLVGDPARGPIDPTSVGILIVNSNVLVDKDVFLTSGNAVVVDLSGLVAATPSIQDDVIAGNINGIVINDGGAGALAQPLNIANNTIVDNTLGLAAFDSPISPFLANVANNIFWENHDLTASRSGLAVVSSVPNKLLLVSNLFSGNGPSETDPSDDTLNVGSGFNPAILGPTPDSLGNFTGAPAFVASRDPRPTADGPAEFFIDANFDLTANSAAIDAANPGLAPAVDFLYRSRVRIAGRGFPGTGPADVGAYEFMGTGGIAAGGAFRVASTSLASGGAAAAAGSTVSTQTLGNSIVVDFSGPVNQSSVLPSDLVLSGTGVDAADPVHAVAISWLDAHTAKFQLAGEFNSTGTVSVSIPSGSVQSQFNEPLRGFSDTVQVTNVVTSPQPTTPAGQTTTPLTPAPAAAPTNPGVHVKKHKVVHGKKHPVGPRANAHAHHQAKTRPGHRP